MKTPLYVISGFIVSLVLASCSLLSDTADTEQHARLLSSVIDSRSVEDKQRDVYRNPQETLTFFGVKPGMTVVEVLPGGGWYSKILAPYLGDEGRLHAVNYADTMWDLFGFMSPDFIAERKAQMQNWSSIVEGYGGNGKEVKGFAFDAVPDEVVGQIDAVLMIRALHNLNRFEANAGTRSRAIAEVFQMLKPNGIVGVVQHRSSPVMPDDWANGKNGYLKMQAVIDMFEAQGFRFVASSEINANLADKPTLDDVVWRLPPSLRGVKNDPAVLKSVLAIGESDRMTLKFIKPE